jgi:HAD superfamily hydrolase (TIGR01549 family)
VLTRRLLAEHGVDATLEEVTARFEALYQGAGEGEENRPGLRETEGLLIPRDVLERLADRLPCAVVTGRPRSDMQHFLDTHDLAGLFSASVCMGETAPKPDPACVTSALEQLGVRRAWLLGDTPDDMRAARGARVLPLGVAAPGDDGAAPGEDGAAMTHALLEAGAGRVLDAPADLADLLERFA